MTMACRLLACSFPQILHQSADCATPQQSNQLSSMRNTDISRTMSACVEIRSEKELMPLEARTAR